MEFLRFGSSIPGKYWGCCAADIIQDFKYDPDEKASIQLVDGDGGVGLMRNGQALYAGPTYREIFETRIRIGTFSDDDMPNHTFFAVLTDEQIRGTNGKKWLKILKENGFEFLRTADNSVYTGEYVAPLDVDDIREEPGNKKKATCSCGDPSCTYDDDDYNDDVGAPHKNYFFALFRNISPSRVYDPFTPPDEWLNLDKVVDETYEKISSDDRLGLAEAQTRKHKELWFANGPTKIKTEKEILDAGAPLTRAGQRLPGAAPTAVTAKDTKKSDAFAA